MTPEEIKYVYASSVNVGDYLHVHQRWNLVLKTSAQAVFDASGINNGPIETHFFTNRMTDVMVFLVYDPAEKYKFLAVFPQEMKLNILAT